MTTYLNITYTLSAHLYYYLQQLRSWTFFVGAPSTNMSLLGYAYGQRRGPKEGDDLWE